MKRVPTFSDVAAAAGVSTATVSRALNHDPKVLPETRQRVFEAAEKIGYIFNDTARSLKTRRSKTIGFVCPELSNSFIMEIAEGIEAKLNKQGYHLLLRHSQKDPQIEASAIAELLSRRVDGLILVPADEEKLPPLFKKTLTTPVLTVDRIWKEQTFPGIHTNNRISSKKGILAFYDKQKEKKEAIWAAMTGLGGINTSRERMKGFQDAMNQLKITHWLSAEDSFDTDGGFRAMKKICQTPEFSSSESINLFVPNYFMHLGATEYLLEQEIPSSRVNICAFDYSPFHRLFQYASLFISQPHMEMGSRAVEYLMALIDNKKVTPRSILENDLIIP